MELARETSRTIAEADPEVALLPTGSTEQHGPHLPLGTDHIAAEAFVRHAAKTHPGAVALPTLPVGVSDHHLQFHGTLSLSPDTFERLLGETLASLAEHGVRKAVVVNGHGGNEAAIQQAGRRLRDEGLAFAAPWNWWDGCQEHAEELLDEGIGHANALETSMMLHLTDAVREEYVEEAEAGAADSWGRTVHGAEIGFDTIDFSESGAVGTPSAGSAEAGAELFDVALEELEALVEWLTEREFAELLPAAHR